MEHENCSSEADGQWTARCSCGWSRTAVDEAVAFFHWSRHADEVA